MSKAIGITSVLVASATASSPLWIDKAILFFQNKFIVKNTPEAQGEQIETAGGAFNNYGNIIKTNQQWKGEVDSPSERFKSFISPAYGFRAMREVLNGLYKKGYKTLFDIVDRYDGNDTNTMNYLSFIQDKAGVDTMIDFGTFTDEQKKKIIFYMAKFEQGANFPVNEMDVEVGYNLA